MANEFESIEIDENIEKMKKISVSHGRKFIKKMITIVKSVPELKINLFPLF